jgi:hypothetical protein
MATLLAYSLFGLSALLAVLRPGWALALVISMYGFEQLLQASGGIFLSISPLTNVSVALCAGFAAIGVLLRTDAPFRGYASPSWIATVGIFAWSAMSLAWSPSAESGGDFVREGIPYFALFILTAPLLATDCESIGRAMRALLLLATLIALAMLLNPEFRSSGGRFVMRLAASVTSNPLAVGELGGALLLVSALIRPRTGGLPYLALRLVAFAAGGVLAFQSGSRGQVVFALVAITAFFPLSRRVASVRGLIGILGLAMVLSILVGVVAPAVLDRSGENRWSSAGLEEGIGSRMNGWEDLLTAQIESPMSWVLGLGFNAFTSVTASPGEVPYSHNVPIDILTELGIPAFVVFIALLARTTADAVWLFRRWWDDDAQRANVAMVAAFAAYYFMIANKQGQLWGSGMLFMFIAVIARLRIREQAALVAAWSHEDQTGVGEAGSGDGADGSISLPPDAEPA